MKNNHYFLQTIESSAASSRRKFGKEATNEKIDTVVDMLDEFLDEMDE